VVLNQVPHNSGEDYGYYTANYTYYSDGEKSAGRSVRSGAKDDPAINWS